MNIDQYWFDWFSVEDWQHDVANGDTKLGYNEWVQHQLDVMTLDTAEQHFREMPQKATAEMWLKLAEQYADDGMIRTDEVLSIARETRPYRCPTTHKVLVTQVFRVERTVEMEVEAPSKETALEKVDTGMVDKPDWGEWTDEWELENEEVVAL